MDYSQQQTKFRLRNSFKILNTDTCQGFEFGHEFGFVSDLVMIEIPVSGLVKILVPVSNLILVSNLVKILILILVLVSD